MITLSSLSNTHRPEKKVQRIGRGMGSKRGKTCGRGTKGDKARQGYKQRYGHEGGQLPLYRKLPCRGMEIGRFRSEVFAINLGRLDAHFKDGETISLKSLQEKGVAPRRAPGGLKILSQGEIKKKVTIEAAAFSKAAEEKLAKAGVSFKKVAVGKS
jgi:large subunit ribosomal protein L15